MFLYFSHALIINFICDDTIIIIKIIYIVLFLYFLCAYCLFFFTSAHFVSGLWAAKFVCK
jgi:hypothetical protein